MVYLVDNIKGDKIILVYKYDSVNRLRICMVFKIIDFYVIWGGGFDCVYYLLMRFM